MRSSLSLLVCTALALACLAPTVQATTGVDVSTAVGVSSWECIHGEGHSFAIVRCYQSNGRPDPNCPQTVKNAWSGGMAHVDVYLFPDPTAGNPQGQVSSAINALAAAGISPSKPAPNTFGMLWLDIEGPQYWTSSQSENQAFFQGLVSQAKAMGIRLGVYTSASQWNPIMGSYTGGSSFPLWYAHYDGNPSFSDFEPFGGWSAPSIKQYQGTTSMCSAGVDLSWYPDGTMERLHGFNATRTI
eukprot:m.353485 g.353485  ORF g.353485 m.353485 type:complete len:243 (+) comp16772_c0_seq1:62-790(+)